MSLDMPHPESPPHPLSSATALSSSGSEGGVLSSSWVSCYLPLPWVAPAAGAWSPFIPSPHPCPTSSPFCLLSPSPVHPISPAWTQGGQKLSLVWAFANISLCSPGSILQQVFKKLQVWP